MNPVAEMVSKRETLALPEYERKLDASVRELSKSLRVDILDAFSQRLLSRYEGGLTPDQKFRVLYDFKGARVARLIKEAFFNHRAKRNGEPVLIRAFEHDVLELFRQTGHASYDKEQRQVASAYGKATGMSIRTSLTGKDKQRLNKIVVGGWAVKDYVKLVLKESFDRLTGRMKQAIIIEPTPAKMLARMRKEIEKVLAGLWKQLQGFQFELVTYAANMANYDFVRALQGI